MDGQAAHWKTASQRCRGRAVVWGLGRVEMKAETLSTDVGWGGPGFILLNLTFFFLKDFMYLFMRNTEKETET